VRNEAHLGVGHGERKEQDNTRPLVYRHALVEVVYNLLTMGYLLAVDSSPDDVGMHPGTPTHRPECGVGTYVPWQEGLDNS